MPGRYTNILILSILALIWSSTWVVIKIGLETLPPLLSAGCRFMIAFLALSVYGLFKRHLKFPRDVKSHIFFLYFGLINFFGGYSLVYWGEQYINSGLTSVLFSILPFYVALFSIKLLPSEKITLSKVIGILIGFSGILLIFSDQLYLEHPMALYGMIAVLLSPAFSGLGTIMGKKTGARYHPVVLNTLPLLYTSLTFLMGSWLFEGQMEAQFTTVAIFSFIYLGIFGTAVAFVLYFWVLRHMSAVVVSLITFVTPPMALVWGWIVLGETVTHKLFFGMIIVFSGILVVRSERIREWRIRGKTPELVQPHPAQPKQDIAAGREG